MTDKRIAIIVTVINNNNTIIRIRLFHVIVCINSTNNCINQNNATVSRIELPTFVRSNIVSTYQPHTVYM